MAILTNCFFGLLRKRNMSVAVVLRDLKVWLTVFLETSSERTPYRSDIRKSDLYEICSETFALKKPDILEKRTLFEYSSEIRFPLDYKFIISQINNFKTHTLRGEVNRKPPNQEGRIKGKFYGFEDYG